MASVPGVARQFGTGRPKLLSEVARELHGNHNDNYSQPKKRDATPSPFHCKMLSLRPLRQPAYLCLSRSTIRLPPSRITLRSRAFHATARREDVSALLLTLPHSLLTTLHEVMPWYAAIPASAFVFRGILLWAIGIRSREMTVRF